MRQLVKEFEVKKKSFSSATQTIKLDLPGPLSGLTIEGRVREGVGNLPVRPASHSAISLKLIRHRHEMKAMFDPCVSKVIELIEGQRQQVVTRNNRRVKASSPLMGAVRNKMADSLERLLGRRIW